MDSPHPLIISSSLSSLNIHIHIFIYIYIAPHRSLSTVIHSFTVFSSIFSQLTLGLTMDSDRGRQEGHGGGHQQYSTSELMASAKVVGEAAQSGFGKESGSMDKAKVADAAGDLLGGARQYGKLEEKGMGQYVEKAENYLHNYGGGQSAEKPSESTKPEGHSESGGGGGIGGYMKMAQGFMNK